MGLSPLQPGALLRGISTTTQDGIVVQGAMLAIKHPEQSR